MKYSIIIPMYNAAEYIINTLNSIMTNDLSETEIIIVDDGSTDDCGKLASEHLTLSGVSNYKLVRQDNAGVSAARNRGLGLAEGEYVIFCDADDEILEGLTEELDETYLDGKAIYDFISWPFLASQDGKKKQLCLVDDRPSQEPGVFRAGDYSRNDFLKLHLINGYRVRLGSFAAKREIIEKAKIRFDETCTLGEDVEFFLRVLLKSNLIFIACEPYYCYQKHQGSLAYSYNIRRFEAPLAMKRVADTHEAALLQDEVREYVNNGLFVLHTIYAFDSCISYIKDKAGLRDFYQEYLDKYGEVEAKLREKMKVMNTPPYGVSLKRLIALRISTKAYINYIFYRQGK